MVVDLFTYLFMCELNIDPDALKRSFVSSFGVVVITLPWEQFRRDEECGKEPSLVSYRLKEERWQ